MVAVALCRMAQPDAALERRLFEAARLSQPHAGAELLFLGEDRAGGDAVLVALHFGGLPQALAFRSAVAGIEGVTLQLLHLRLPFDGVPTAALFP
ncbi:hypothetical protein [Neoroseomonas lacus]|uniref:Antibiotic biosynthesis monooxygenase n=1 Tax=Neoroseomonas lacus TaxID=287609 RepID=A0A917KM86_9PROT|nr:hypothetical protein [Neoroseomonas lacus]GGJ20631.1 hypothetical protein GCM10011320_29900 [Neoroseomonas lacus]